ncbi:MAG: hypothetical protein KY466_10810 [Gemmatimonadetes bacterium]|nr:hypothetical protein [Gemmatimonadota bacterium]
MAEELLEFENTVEDGEGKSWVAVVMGAEREDSHWVGWIRFDPAGGGEALVTDRETTQPNRGDLVYWATGLTYFYLEGALARARRKKDKDRASEAAADPAASARPEDSDGARDGDGMRHRFRVQAGDGTSRSNMADWLWSRLHQVGARATVNGSGHLETNADLRQALER